MLKNNLVICDQTGIILEDGVTLYPNYVEVKDGVYYRYISRDPMNQLAKIKPWVLHNRVQFKIIKHKKKESHRQLQGKHFTSHKAMLEYKSLTK